MLEADRVIEIVRGLATCCQVLNVVYPQEVAQCVYPQMTMNLQTICVLEHAPRPGAKKGYGGSEMFMLLLVQAECCFCC